jgi:hypothetical protein
MKLGMSTPMRSEIPALPMSPPIIAWDPSDGLPMLPGAVSGPLDRFRCEPYRATLTARSCIARQDAAAEQSRQRDKGGSGRAFRQGSLLADYSKCPDCPIGPTIRARVSTSQ